MGKGGLPCVFEIVGIHVDVQVYKHGIEIAVEVLEERFHALANFVLARKLNVKRELRKRKK